MGTGKDSRDSFLHHFGINMDLTDNIWYNLYMFLRFPVFVNDGWISSEVMHKNKERTDHDYSGDEGQEKSTWIF